jgi:C4-dicarboxylate-specific signal transduction histidine kinase
VQVDIDATDGPPVRVLADPVALEQIVHNLLVNAIQALDAVPPGTRRIAIAVQLLGDQGRLAVGDSGPGIAPELRPRLFEPFFTTREGGLGLGLSLSETLATGMGGTLSAAPPGGAHGLRGACFHLDLQLA